MKTVSSAYRFAVSLALVGALFPFYVEGAVGIVDTPVWPTIRLQLGVLAIGIIGAVIARFQPHGMARALFVTALAQALVAVSAVIAGMGAYTPAYEILGVNGIVVALFVGSAWLFRRAARSSSAGGAQSGTPLRGDGLEARR